MTPTYDVVTSASIAALTEVDVEVLIGKDTQHAQAAIKRHWTRTPVGLPAPRP